MAGVGAATEAIRVRKKVQDAFSALLEMTPPRARKSLRRIVTTSQAGFQQLISFPSGQLTETAHIAATSRVTGKGPGGCVALEAEEALGLVPRGGRAKTAKTAKTAR